MTKRKPTVADIPPPPTTGGTHTWDFETKAWVTTDATHDAAQPAVAAVDPEPAPAATLNEA